MKRTIIKTSHEAYDKFVQLYPNHRKLEGGYAYFSCSPDKFVKKFTESKDVSKDISKGVKVIELTNEQAAEYFSSIEEDI
jgi:hypothetical protein